MKNLELLEEIYSPLLTAKYSREVAIGLLVLVSLLFLGTTVSVLTHWYDDIFLTQQKPIVKVDMENHDAQLISQIPAQHIFGKAPDDDFLPITSLQLHLTGVMKNSDDTVSQVIISEAGEPGKVYSVGDVLTSGIKIDSISSDGVVLEHNGRLEKLPLSRPRLDFQDKPKTLWEEN